MHNTSYIIQTAQNNDITDWILLNVSISNKQIIELFQNKIVLKKCLNFQLIISQLLRTMLFFYGNKSAWPRM